MSCESPSETLGARLPGVLDWTRADITKASCHKDLRLNVAVKHFCVDARMSCISTYRLGWSLPRCLSGFNLQHHVAEAISGVGMVQKPEL